MNPHTGDIYLLQCTGSGTYTADGFDIYGNPISYTLQPGGIHKYSFGSLDYNRVADTPESSFASGYFNLPIGCALTWWDGAITGGNADGALVLYSGQVGGIYVCNTDTFTWSAQYGFPAQSGYYHVVSAYSKIHNCMVFGGGNNFQSGGESDPDPTGALARKVFRLNSDLTVTAMPDAPFRLGVDNGMNVVADRRSGNIIFLGKGEEWPVGLRDDHPEHWSLDPSGSGTWTQLAAPPSEVLNPSKAMPFVSCDTPYGPVYIQTLSTVWRMYLWRS